ncbi:glutathione hydrolase 6 isoform X2 [Perognathus longimembris pacificus]|uniref:glutathione hydrolase 6 isoform X2 n=1 Tax=Perognathus longimembris pacificus TaxID=214514 RepID=UPI00201845EA|nr:glutathione hydrolase 6 isoform X2 [Perognathus longimembris pacificus]
MEASGEPVLYHKLQIWEPGAESEEEEEEEILELLFSNPRRPQDIPGNKAGGLPGAWARVGAALVLLAVSCFLAVRQLQSRGYSAGSWGSLAPPVSSHRHRPGVFHHSAIISLSATCSHLGQELLVAGGNVVDAGVGAALCLAVVHPHVTGLGATFWGLFYNSSSGNSTALTAGPAQTLALGLELPGALPALHLLHTRFGCLPWSRLLVGPTLLAQEGFEVDAPLASALAAQGTRGLCPLLCHADGTPLGLGMQATNPQLAAVLRRAALAPNPDLTGKALLGLLAKDLGLEEPLAWPRPSLEPALQLSVPQGILFTTPSPSAGPELLAQLEAALPAGTPSPAPCPQPLPMDPASSILATVDSGGSTLLLTSSLHSAFGARYLSPSTGVLLRKLVAGPAHSAWACPLVLRGGLDDPEADVVGLVASGTPKGATAMTHALLSHLSEPQTQHQHQVQQEPTENPSPCGHMTLLQATAHAEHAHVSSVPRGCCPFQGF